jgi:hypothetical protein
MKNLTLLFVAALSFAAFGCKKKGGDCDKAIANSMEVSKADMAKMPGVDDKMLAKMHDLGVQHCKDDKWPEDAVKCMTDAKTETDGQACYGKLAPEQQDKMNKATIALMTPPAAAGAGSAGSGSSAGSAPANGSDTGSAGSSAAPADTGSGSAGSAAAPK